MALGTFDRSLDGRGSFFWIRGSSPSDPGRPAGSGAAEFGPQPLPPAEVASPWAVSLRLLGESLEGASLPQNQHIGQAVSQLTTS